MSMKKVIAGPCIIPFLLLCTNSFSYDEENVKKFFSRPAYYKQVKKRYDYIEDCRTESGLRRVRYKGKWGLIDSNGREVIRIKYDNIGNLYNNRIYVELNHKWGYIDKTGKEVIPLKYDQAYSFVDGLAIIVLNGKCGYINIKGEELIPPKYDSVNDFEKGFAKIKLKNKWGLIDRKGREIIPPKYDDIGSFNNGIARIRLKNKIGLINTRGEEIVAPKYEYISLTSDGELEAKLNDHIYKIDNKTGKVYGTRYISSPQRPIIIKKYLSLGPSFAFLPDIAIGAEVSFIFYFCQSFFTGVYTDYLFEPLTGNSRFTLGPGIGDLPYGVDGGLVLNPGKGISGYALRPFIFLVLTPIMAYYRFMSSNESGDREYIHQIGISLKIPFKISGERCGGSFLDY